MLKKYLSKKGKQIIEIIKDKKTIVAFLFAVTIIILRKPDAILNAQFWAEDGVIWFAEAYNQGGVNLLLNPQNGYFQSISRITAWLPLLISVPLQYSPLFFNIIAITIKALPVGLLWSKRFKSIVPSNKARWLISLTYLLLPNIGEVHSNITNAHWHLALYAFMIIIADPPKSIWNKAHDVFFLIIAGLSGPFSIILAPIVLFYGWCKRKKISRLFYFYLIIILLTASIQMVSVILTSDATRSHVPLGASIPLFIQIMSAKLFGIIFLGEGMVNNIIDQHYLSIPFFLIGTFITFYALIKAKIELKLFIVFSMTILFVALHSPMISLTEEQWPLMYRAETGSRYFFLPLIAWATSLFWFISTIKIKKVKVILVSLITLFMTYVFITDFKIKAYDDFKFSEHIDKFETLPPKASYSIPINPKNWNIILIKKD